MSEWRRSIKMCKQEKGVYDMCVYGDKLMGYSLVELSPVRAFTEVRLCKMVIVVLTACQIVSWVWEFVHVDNCKVQR